MAAAAAAGWLSRIPENSRAPKRDSSELGGAADKRHSPQFQLAGIVTRLNPSYAAGACNERRCGMSGAEAIRRELLARDPPDFHLWRHVKDLPHTRWDYLGI